MDAHTLLIAQLLDPAALAIVGGGTLCVTVLRNRMRDIARAAAALATLGRGRFDAAAGLAQIAALDRIAHRHGVVALDRTVIADGDIAAAIDAIVDGNGGDAVAALVAHRRGARIERHRIAAEVWTGMAEAAPAMGMVGTLIGLARMFATMGDPTAIGGAMAVALLATLYGALIANLIAAPVAHRLRTNARIEAFERARFEAPLAALAAREMPRTRLQSVA